MPCDDSSKWLPPRRQESGVRIGVSSRGDRLQNRPGTWFTQRGGKLGLRVKVVGSMPQLLALNPPLSTSWGDAVVAGKPEARKRLMAASPRSTAKTGRSDRSIARRNRAGATVGLPAAAGPCEPARRRLAASIPLPRRDATPSANTPPRAPTPIDPPTVRKKGTRLVATPRWRSGATCWIASTCESEEGPSPAPTTPHAALIQATPALARAAATRPARPARTRTAPKRAVRRNPKRRIIRPAAAAEVAQKKMSGVTTAPAAPAVPPRAPCTKRGTNVSTPKIVVPSRIPAREGDAVSHRRKRSGGTSGCSRRVWSLAKTPSETAPARRSPARGRSDAPAAVGDERRTAKRTSVTPRARVEAPATSTGSGSEGRDSFSRVATRKKAIAPRGMLIEKMDLQPKCTVRNAPINGPTRAANPHTPEKSPWIRARSCSE